MSQPAVTQQTIPPGDRTLLKDLLALMRMDRPVGTLLLLWPTLAALWMAAGGQPGVDLILIFSLGTLLMRSAGCVMNDIADRNFDGHVARTADRPLAAGRVSVGTAAFLLLALLLAAALLLLGLNPLTRWLAVAGLALALTYPFFKRFTYLPQVPLGAAFSWAMIMAFAAVQNTGLAGSHGSGRLTSRQEQRGRRRQRQQCPGGDVSRLSADNRWLCHDRSGKTPEQVEIAR